MTSENVLRGPPHDDNNARRDKQEPVNSGLYYYISLASDQNKQLSQCKKGAARQDKTGFAEEGTSCRNIANNTILVGIKNRKTDTLSLICSGSQVILVITLSIVSYHSNVRAVWHFMTDETSSMTPIEKISFIHRVCY